MVTIPLSLINFSYYTSYADVTIRQHLVTCTGFLKIEDKFTEKCNQQSLNSYVNIKHD